MQLRQQQLNSPKNFRNSGHETDTARARAGVGHSRTASFSTRSSRKHRPWTSGISDATSFDGRAQSQKGNKELLDSTRACKTSGPSTAGKNLIVLKRCLRSLKLYTQGSIHPRNHLFPRLSKLLRVPRNTAEHAKRGRSERREGSVCRIVSGRVVQKEKIM